MPFEHRPNRLPGNPKNGEGVLSMADNTKNEVPVVNSTTPDWLKPAAGSILPQWAVIALTVLAIIAGVVLLIPGMPPTVTAIASGVAALAGALGIASPGIRRQVDQSTQPRVGPPEP